MEANKELQHEGGDVVLLANTATKASKPPESTPTVRVLSKLANTFDPIGAARKKGDAAKAKT
jgi:hypothetical protein